MDTPELQANADRFARDADLYDAVRPTPPDDLAALLVRYAGGARPGLVVDLGSGSGLSTRWAATWADDVIGVEPGDAMRAVAERVPTANVTYRAGWSHATGLPARCADMVLAVQALHWMEPTATFAEVARILRPGGVFAAIDCDWPPSTGDVGADMAWDEARRRILVYEQRVARGLDATARQAPVDLRDLEAQAQLRAHSPADTHVARTTAFGVQSWAKTEHLRRMIASDCFAWCHEVGFHRTDDSPPSRFVDLLRSQGDYQSLRAVGFTDDELGARAVTDAAERAWAGRPTRPLHFTYRARIGVRP